MLSFIFPRSSPIGGTLIQARTFFAQSNSTQATRLKLLTRNFPLHEMPLFWSHFCFGLVVRVEVAEAKKILCLINVMWIVDCLCLWRMWNQSNCTNVIFLKMPFPKHKTGIECNIYSTVCMFSVHFNRGRARWKVQFEKYHSQHWLRSSFVGCLHCRLWLFAHVY